jgi:hypothetical protein
MFIRKYYGQQRLSNLNEIQVVNSNDPNLVVPIRDFVLFSSSSILFLINNQSEEHLIDNLVADIEILEIRQKTYFQKNSGSNLIISNSFSIDPILSNFR